MAIKDALIKELRNKIAYDEDNMLLLKDEFQNKISKIEKQSRLAEIQSENIMLKEEIRQQQNILESLESPENASSQYYHCYVKVKKELMTLMNELASLLSIHQMFDT